MEIISSLTGISTHQCISRNDMCKVYRQVELHRDLIQALGFSAKHFSEFSIIVSIPSTRSIHSMGIF